jgi:HD-GYP domain-containing protein (c-di-GMP phosphodiesterase class II)
MSRAPERGIVERIADALRARVHHPQGHPALHTPLRHAASELALRLVTREPLALSLVGDLVVLGSVAMDGSDERLRPLHDALRLRGVASLVLRSDVTLSELESLVELLGGSFDPEASPCALAKSLSLRHVSIYDTEAGAWSEALATERVRAVHTWCVDAMDELARGVRDGSVRETTRAQRAVRALLMLLTGSESALLACTLVRGLHRRVAQHAVHTAIVALGLGRHIGLATDNLERVGLAALLHDVGIDPEPLRRPATLTREERQELERHPRRSAELLDGLGVDDQTLALVQQHHVRFDGTGYPALDSDQDRHPLAGLVGIADCYAALTAGGPYQRPHTPDQALRVIENLEGAYDPEHVVRLRSWLSAHPVGELVRLVSNELAIVESRGRATTRLRIVRDGHGQLLAAPGLPRAHGTHEVEHEIVCPVDPLVKGIDVASFVCGTSAA